MDTFDVFKRRLASLQSLIKNNDEEYVCVEIQGLHVVEINRHKNNDQTFEILGFDENGNETVLIFPFGHFNARLSIEKKIKGRPTIGFKIENKEADSIKIN
jgi:hypothetical protein